MLVLTRTVGESLLIGSDIIVTVERIRDGSVRLGIRAPREIPVIRLELASLAGQPSWRRPTAEGKA
jgi:carbon storage regulator